LSASSVPTSHLGFTGHEQDGEGGLVNMRGRVFDTRTSRFLTPDPLIQFPYTAQSFNRYAYVLNNPVNLVDPSGFEVQSGGTSGAGSTGGTGTSGSGGPGAGSGHSINLGTWMRIRDYCIGAVECRAVAAKLGSSGAGPGRSLLSSDNSGVGSTSPANAPLSTGATTDLDYQESWERAWIVNGPDVALMVAEVSITIGALAYNIVLVSVVAGEAYVAGRLVMQGAITGSGAVSTFAARALPALARAAAMTGAKLGLDGSRGSQRGMGQLGVLFGPSRASTGLADLGKFRNGLGLPVGAGTLARLDVGGRSFYGINAHGQAVSLRVNAISATHAEADVFQQATNAQIGGGRATLFVDRALCPACGLNGGVRGMARQLGLTEIEIITPQGTSIMKVGP